SIRKIIRGQKSFSRRRPHSESWTIGKTTPISPSAHRLGKNRRFSTRKFHLRQKLRRTEVSNAAWFRESSVPSKTNNHQIRINVGSRGGHWPPQLPSNPHLPEEVPLTGRV